MSVPGQDPCGGGPPKGPSTGPTKTIVEDLGMGPRPGEKYSAYRERTVAHINRLNKEEEKLSGLRLELKKFRASYDRVYTMKPQLEILEQRVSEQVKMVAALKAASGILRERYTNEDRFRSARSKLVAGARGHAEEESSLEEFSDAPAGEGACRVEADPASPPMHAEEVLPAVKVVGSSSIPPQQQQQPLDWGSQEEVAERAGTMHFIKEMESPLHVKQFAFTSEESEDEDDRCKKPAKPREKERAVFVSLERIPSTLVTSAAAGVKVSEVLGVNPSSSEVVAESSGLSVGDAKERGVSLPRDVSMQFGGVKETGVCLQVSVLRAWRKTRCCSPEAGVCLQLRFPVASKIMECPRPLA
ncbi:unnamed protein product, partial [Staurois parvus]